MDLKVRYKAGTSTTTSYLATYPLVTTKPASYALGIRYDNTNYYVQLERGYTKNRPRFYIGGKSFRIATESYDPLTKNEYKDTVSAYPTSASPPVVTSPGVCYFNGTSMLTGSTDTSAPNYHNFMATFTPTVLDGTYRTLAQAYASDTKYCALRINTSNKLEYVLNGTVIATHTTTLQLNKEYRVEAEWCEETTGKIKLTYDGDSTQVTVPRTDSLTGNCKLKIGGGRYSKNNYFIGTMSNLYTSMCNTNNTGSSTVTIQLYFGA